MHERRHIEARGEAEPGGWPHRWLHGRPDGRPDGRPGRWSDAWAAPAGDRLPVVARLRAAWRTVDRGGAAAEPRLADHLPVDPARRDRVLLPLLRADAAERARRGRRLGVAHWRGDLGDLVGPGTAAGRTALRMELMFGGRPAFAVRAGLDPPWQRLLDELAPETPTVPLARLLPPVAAPWDRPEGGRDHAGDPGGADPAERLRRRWAAHDRGAGDREPEVRAVIPEGAAAAMVMRVLSADLVERIARGRPVSLTHWIAQVGDGLSPTTSEAVTLARAAMRLDARPAEIVRRELPPVWREAIASAPVREPAAAP